MSHAHSAATNASKKITASVGRNANNRASVVVRAPDDARPLAQSSAELSIRPGD